ncbi:17026_t:CDS:2 [Entrophospora sp. SA101]|nr:2750_t:CDS:2 [Entrophospora sp. SA101]CAJ0824843.1 17026_t:CDS:2 [Entrophospora sp. SA101]
MDAELVKQLLEIIEKNKIIEAENEKLAEENDNYKNEFAKCKQAIEAKHNEHVNKLVEIINKLKENSDKLNQEAEHYRNKLISYQREIEPKYKEEVKKLRQERELYRNELIEYQQKVVPKLKETNDNIKKDLLNAHSVFNAENNKLQQSITHAEKKISELETDNQNKINIIRELKKSYGELEDKNEKLRKEASSYQSADYNMRNEDGRNSSVQLTNDLITLHEKIEKYVTTLKGAVVINNEKIIELFKRYNLKIKKHTIKDKILMKSVLQRYVLEKVLEYVDEYLNNVSNDHPCNQEKQIMNHTDKLLNLLDEFHDNHLIKDNKKRNNKSTTTTKIRGQVYGLLVQKLNALMAEYRQINDANKKNYTENMAENLIKEIVRIFKFRLLTHEQKYELYWFKHNDKIMPEFMKGAWDDDSSDDYVVNVCFFPLIGTNLKVVNNNNKGSKSEILAYAKICPQSVISSQESSEEEEEKIPSKNNNSNNVINNILKNVIENHNSNQQHQNSSDKNDNCKGPLINSNGTSGNLNSSSSNGQKNNNLQEKEKFLGDVTDKEKKDNNQDFGELLDG